MKRIMYGWKSAHNKQLFVYETKSGWGVEYTPENAAKFNSITECIAHWQSKHAIRENFAALLLENHLQFFDAKTGQQLNGVFEIEAYLVNFCSYFFSPQCKFHQHLPPLLDVWYRRNGLVV